VLRNLIYHLCPLTKNEEWKLNVSELLKYIDIFNNKKVISICCGKSLEDPEVVKSMFDSDVEFIEIENNPKVGELASFLPLFSRVHSLNENENTFYAHTKGVHRTEIDKSIIKNMRLWRNCMYKHCLRDPLKIERILKDHVCCGCFKGVDKKFVPKTNFHFAGTFFWFNNKKVFSNPNWKEIPYSKFGIEVYLGRHFNPNEAHCLFGKGTMGWMFYNSSAWPKYIREQYFKKVTHI